MGKVQTGNLIGFPYSYITLPPKKPKTKHRDFGMMILCTVLALLLYPGGKEKYSYLVFMFPECEIHSETVLCP